MGGRVQIGGVWCGWEGADRRGVVWMVGCR